MYGALRFWLDRGVDGFRVDVIWHLIKDDQFRDNPPNRGYQPGDSAIREYLQVYSADRPEVHEIVQEMRRVVDEYPQSLLIGEIYLPIERLVTYYGPELRGAHLPFNFQLIESQWNARGISKMIREYEAAIPPGGWPNWVLGNHDQKRIATRIGISQARIAAMLLLTLRGTPTLYYGDEIGMKDVLIPTDRIRDPWEKNEPGLGVGRDPSRTPMQWSAEPHAGFTDGEPWLPVADDFAAFNVDALDRSQSSILTLYRRLIRLRRKHRCLRIGSYEPVKTDDDALVYQRVDGDERVVVALNFGREAHLLTLPPSPAEWRPLLTATLMPLPERIRGRLMLAPNEGVILAPVD
jgi:alpha-glucosidase